MPAGVTGLAEQLAAFVSDLRRAALRLKAMNWADAALAQAFDEA
jgi:hypothetical protein